MIIGRLRGLRTLLLSMLALASAFAVSPAQAANTSLDAVADICGASGGMQTVTLDVGDVLEITNTQSTCTLMGMTSLFGSVGTYNVNPGTGDITVNITVAGSTATATWSGGILTMNVNAAPASNDATLSGLTTTAGTLTPTFSSGTTSYTASVGNATTSITVTPTVNEATATVTVDGVSTTSGAASGAISLNVGSNSISVVVTAGDGTTTETYTLDVTRGAAGPSNDATLSALTPSTGTLSPTFAGGTTSYSVSVNNATSSIRLTPTVNEATATVTVNGVSTTSGAPSAAVSLNVGSNSIPVHVTAGDGTTTRTYTVNVTRAGVSSASSDATLKALTTSTELSISPAFNSGVTDYFVYAAPPVTVTPTVNNASATVTVNGAAVTSGTPSGEIQWVKGDTTAIIVVTAADGITTKTYTIRFAPVPLTKIRMKLTTDFATISSVQLTSGFVDSIAGRLKTELSTAAGVPANRIKAQGIAVGFLESQNGETAGGMSGLGMMQVLAAEAEQSSSASSLRLDPGSLTGLDKVLSEYGIGLWTAGTIGKGGYGKGSAAFDFSTANLSLGFDGRLSEKLLAGIAFGYGKTHSEIDDSGTEFSARALSVALYGTWQAADKIFVDASAGYTDLSFESHRWESFDEALLSGDRDAGTWFGSLTLNASLRQDNAQFIPYLQTTVSSTSFDAYSETGASFLGLTYEKSTLDNAAFTAGLRVSYDHAFQGGRLSPYAKGDFTLNTNEKGKQGAFYTNFGPSTATVLEDEVISKGVGTGELGLSYTTKGGTQGSIWGRGSVGSNDLSTQSLGLSLQANF
jgi:outer membrane autotransporter protein